jgi:enamine deaminase RidA (YjgF/YER057c/UK114 family)
MIEGKFKELTGYDIPTAPKPLAAYVPAKLSHNYVYTSGQLPFKEGKLIAEGKVGREVDEVTAIECAKTSIINCLSAVKTVVDDLDKIKQIVKLTVFVSSADGFTAQPKIANGASEFLVELFGEKGKHSRSAVGVSELPINAPVEIEMIVELNN